MGRQVDIEDLVGTVEIADRLDVSHPQTINTWRRRHPDFPHPVTSISSINVWLWPEIEEWARRTGRIPAE